MIAGKISDGLSGSRGRHALDIPSEIQTLASSAATAIGFAVATTSPIRRRAGLDRNASVRCHKSLKAHDADGAELAIQEHMEVILSRLKKGQMK